ncbi:hypothetical protein A2U01_0069628, partial [Trifolium medium]|nr:hypothetical protein [Trifolium medium]
MALKESHGSHSNNLPGRIASLKARLFMLDGKGEDEMLTDDE